MDVPTPGTPAASLAGRRALVTGGASGIGAAVAVRLAEAGAAVTVVDRDEEGAAKVAAGLGALAPAGADHDHRVLDLADPAAIDRLDLPAGGVDILVNSAGLQHVAPVEELDPERFRLIHAVMLQAPFLLARRLLPGMYAAGWGRIVHVSSVHGHRASAYKSAYVSAKHGLEGLSKVIALEAADKGVTSNTVCPGYVRTPLVEGQIADQDPEVLAQAVVGVVEQLTQTYIFERKEPVDRAADAAVAFCLKGLVGS
jgi:3-hydroxybutyrate dehydrogenase